MRIFLLKNNTITLNDYQSAIANRRDLLTELLSELAVYAQSFRASLPQMNFMSKADNSPVTEMDLLIQAAFSDIVGSLFPNDRIIGEEQIDEQTKNQLFSDHLPLMTRLREFSKDKAVDLDHQMIWVIDPIDGTKGFIRNLVFAIGVALLAGQDVLLSAIACCNLSLFFDELDSLPLIAMASAKEGGAQFFYSNGKEINRGQRERSEKPVIVLSRTEMSAVFSETESAIGYRMVGIDSMAKYVVVALGLADAYVRAPIHGKAMLWDHLPGLFLIHCEQGESVDFHLQPIEYSIDKQEVYLSQGLINSLTKNWASQFLKIMSQSPLK